MKTEWNVDAYRLAVLPLAYLGEQPDPFDWCRGNGAIDESYRSVVSTGLWLYALYNYLLLVRDKLGDNTADVVWSHQKRLLSGGVGEAEKQIGRVFDLIQDAARVCSTQPATDATAVGYTVELHIALTLLLHLPESPVYSERESDQGAQGDKLRADVGRRFATCLSRCRDEIVRIFFTTFSVTDPRPQ